MTGGPCAAQQPRLHLAHETREQRRQQQHQQHLRALHRRGRAITATARAPAAAITSATKTRLRYLPDRQELEPVEPCPRRSDADSDGRIEAVPDEIPQFDGEPRRRAFRRAAACRPVSRARKTMRAEHPADRLGEAAGGVLRRWARVGKAAVPGRRPAHRVRGEAVDRQGGQRCRDGDEDEDQQPVVGAAALSDRHDRQPRRIDSVAACGSPTSARTDRRQAHR